ncbi:unnamed protein product [Cryptosporidium hominis]|uniref:Uncharacterized protein n=1 Tax=Cryptosporidium hominis TaxID=237895 RepID=A0A0S4TAC0_CRYHO|nr:hypothetical protein [Cryptosporidium hominis TU502]OLQ16017.1 hypothetical protein ChTU502y2012_305g0285 [Cryptosporidium hominis]PPA63406.1 hypothetical protein ChUKH1_07690 [Cryptosporidium hominis]PPS97309.1 Uncharacterized protein GY17_00001183 [Cryptosporidium hominis]CUV04120.1 unnamed protein product [Cryptosporidium hominis]|eukprot:PPS97309.1 Uncharacterized protein GY17_00001183 [Cryptosporidium hominis]
MCGFDLVGIILTVKWPYQEPEIIFYHPPSSFSILNEKNVIQTKECFGHECSKLAPLILPSDSALWNKMSDLVIESKDFQHRFVFFPSSTIHTKSLNQTLFNNIQKKININNRNLKLDKFIESFSVTLVFIASTLINYEFIEEKLFRIASTLLSCEIANNFISVEILRSNETSFEYLKNLYKSCQNNKGGASIGSEHINLSGSERSNLQEHIFSIVEKNNRLSKKLIKYFTRLKIDCNDFTVTPSKPHQFFSSIDNNCLQNPVESSYDELTFYIDKSKLSNIYKENELINEISNIADPHLSIRDISVELLEQPSNILKVCQKLITKKVAKVLEIIRYDKVYVICPDSIKTQVNRFNLKYRDIIDWKGCNPLILISSFFCNGKKLCDVRSELVEFFQKFTREKRASERLIYYPYESSDKIYSSNRDEALKIVKSIISWLYVNGCIEVKYSTNAPNDNIDLFK